MTTKKKMMMLVMMTMIMLVTVAMRRRQAASARMMIRSSSPWCRGIAVAEKRQQIYCMAGQATARRVVGVCLPLTDKFDPLNLGNTDLRVCLEVLCFRWFVPFVKEPELVSTL